MLSLDPDHRRAANLPSNSLQMAKPRARFLRLFCSSLSVRYTLAASSDREADDWVRAIKHQSKEAPAASAAGPGVCQGYLSRLESGTSGGQWKRQYLVLSPPVLTAYSSVKAMVRLFVFVRLCHFCRLFVRRSQTNSKSLFH